VKAVAHHEQFGNAPRVIVLQGLAVDRLIEQQAGRQLHRDQRNEHERHVSDKAGGVRMGQNKAPLINRPELVSGPDTPSFSPTPRNVNRLPMKGNTLKWPTARKEARSGRIAHSAGIGRRKGPKAIEIRVAAAIPRLS
jgi:hypothetical protein